MFQPPLIPDDLDVPAFKAFDTFALIALDMDRAEEDFALVDANRAHLAGTFGPANPWPEGVDLRMNRADVAWHEVEFRCRTSFAYWITDAPRPDAALIGCLYITPSPRTGDDCALYFWLSTEHVARTADIETALKAWLRTDWHFPAVVLPGRDIPWTEWG
tara:strand:- start:3760 stop:4239 length:480 start_codon:yes stop_codon:yes gene_type:complete